MCDAISMSVIIVQDHMASQSSDAPHLWFIIHDYMCIINFLLIIIMQLSNKWSVILIVGFNTL